MEKVRKFITENQLSGAGSKLLAANKCLELIEEIKSEKLKLGGFDGFYIWPDGIQIEQDISRDYSHQSWQDAYDLAEDFFQERIAEKDIGYELVFVERT